MNFILSNEFLTKRKLAIMATTHKTEHFTDRQRKELAKSALTQDEAVRLFFSKEVGSFTVEDVYNSLRLNRIISPKTPITSIRRSMTNLSDNPKRNITNGYLEKTTDVEQGDFGKNIHKWRRKIESKQSELFN